MVLFHILEIMEFSFIILLQRSCHPKDERMYYLKDIQKTLAILASNGDNLPAARVLSALSHALFSFNNQIFIN